MESEARNRATLEERLRGHPELREHIEGLLDEVDNRGGVLNTADEAEDALVVRLRAMGREAMQGWAERRQGVVQPGWEPSLRRGGKKNSAG
jgi:hypothetical protein